MDITEWIVATGAVGTAAFGVVDALKGTSVGTWGSERIKVLLGPEFWGALAKVYGDGLESLVQASFRRGAEPLAEMLKNGFRVAIADASVARSLGEKVLRLDAEPTLDKVVATLRSDASSAMGVAVGSTAPSVAVQSLGEVEAARAVLARFEILAEARVDAAVCAALQAYASAMRRLAMVFALIGGIVVGATYAWSDGSKPMAILQGLLVGLAAVPIAPVANDLVKLLTAARGAIGARGGG